MANVNLSQRDLDYIARVVDTEVPKSVARTNPTEYRRMVNAVVDTVTNRIASGQYPSTVTGVANQKNQFSKINGPSYLDPYGSVQAAPPADASTRAIVDDYVASRAQGTLPEIGGSLNYANPNFSSPSNLSGWINPMIDNGAIMMGTGQNLHVHGTAPGMTPAGPYSLTAEAIPSGPVATPTSRPSLLGSSQTKPSNALLGYGPDTVQRASLADPQDTGMFDSGRFAGPVTSPSPKTSVTAFDNERFGPANTQMSIADQYSAYGTGRAATEAAIQKSQQAFDNARFGPQVTTPTPSFDPGRFGPAPTPVAQGMEGLRKGLLDQQLNEGILPSIQYTAPLQQQTVTPGYVDPQVTTQQPVAATNSLLSNAAVQPPPQVQNGLLSQPEYNAVQAAGGFNPVNPNYALSAQVEKGMSNRRLGGGLLGGLAGGILLGPIGAIAGGLLGRNYAQKTYYPPAPAPSIDEQARKAAGLNKSYQGSGYNSLSGYGKSVYSGSGQFSSAVDSGKGGLW